MLGAFTTVMGNAGVNISDMTNKGKGDYAYTMMDLESEATEEIVKALVAVDGVLKVRIIKENQKVTGKGGARKQGYRLFLSRTAEVTAV